jgi:hypothetical protein
MCYRTILAAVLGVLGVLGCDNPSPSAAPEPSGTVLPTPPAPAQSANAPAAGVDPGAVEKATGIKPEVTEGVVKVSYPRGDVKVEVDGWPMPPFMGLTSWAGFTPGQAQGVEAMVMGDLVVFQDEVGDAMTAALNNGLKVTALHNHFFFDKPHVYFRTGWSR